jgi:hypothetical protein
VRQTTTCRADLMATTGQFSCPPVGSSMAVSGQFLVAAVTPERQGRVGVGRKRGAHLGRGVLNHLAGHRERDLRVGIASSVSRLAAQQLDAVNVTVAAVEALDAGRGAPCQRVWRSAPCDRRPR